MPQLNVQLKATLVLGNVFVLFSQRSLGGFERINLDTFKNLKQKSFEIFKFCVIGDNLAEILIWHLEVFLRLLKFNNLIKLV